MYIQIIFTNYNHVYVMIYRAINNNEKKIFNDLLKY